jgi:hypothetical protein
MTPAQQYANWANQPQNQQRPAAIRDAQGNIYDSQPSAIAQDVGGKGGYMGPGGEVYDASHNLVTSNANLTAQAAAGPGATMTGNPMLGGGGGGISPQVGGAIASGIGAIGSAIQSALSNVPSWKIQPSAIPDPTSFKRNTPSYNFQAPSA